MIKFDSVQVTPTMVNTGGQYIIRVKAHYVPEFFKFPLLIPKVLGIIFKKKG